MSEPTVSIVLVARDEPAARLRRAIASVRAQDYAGDVEVVVASPIGDRAALPPETRWVENPTGRRTPGLNRAVAATSGEIVCRTDARATLPPDYVARCVERLEGNNSIGVVGGHQHPVAPPGAGVVARGIARALRNPWALGAADYRVLGRSGPTDTVYLGAFRRREFLALGGFDEELDANEDFELCHRFATAGRQVWLEDVAVGYEPREHLGALWRQYLAFGRAKVRYWRRTGDSPNRRQRLALILAPFGVFLWPLSIVLDHVAERHERSVRVRLVASFAYGVIIGGWLAGVAVEAATRWRRS